MKRGRPKLLEPETRIKFNIILPKAEMDLLREAKEKGKLFSFSEAIRTGLRMYLKQIGA